jgi:hypothetical protein
MTTLADCAVEPRVSGSGVTDRSYRIPSHVHVCVTGDGSVLLDLKRDKYFGIGRQDTLHLAAVVEGWPKLSREYNLDESRSREDAERICRTMLDEGLLLRAGAPALERFSKRRGTENSTNGAPVGWRAESRIDMTAPFVSVGDELEVGADIRFMHVVRVAAAYAWALYSLRGRPPMATVEAVRAQKNRRPEAGALWDLERIASLIDIFRRLRPYLFAAEGRCLVHALTIVRFLGSHGVYPDWVIGVATQPWGAHSWVQWGNYLLDTNPEKVCRYTPILVV